MIWYRCECGERQIGTEVEPDSRVQWWHPGNGCRPDEAPVVHTFGRITYQ